MSLEQEYTKLMNKMESQAFYRRVFLASLERASQIARAHAASPKPGSRFQKYLGALPKQARSALLLNWKPFRAVGPPHRTGKTWKMEAEIGVAESAYLGEHEDVQKLVTQSVIAELNANPQEWLGIVLRDMMRSKSK